MEFRRFEKVSLAGRSFREAYLASQGLTEDDLARTSEISFSNGGEFRKFAESRKGKKTAVIGDYDVDGVMSSRIMKMILTASGSDAPVILPNRFVDGYGLKSALVDKALSLGCTAIVTVDNGIAAKDAVAYAQSKGLEVFVTDHHVAGDSVPDCPTVDPQTDAGMTFKGICGAEVAYFLAKQEGLLTGTALEEARQLATVAMVADVMPVLDVNRRLLKQFVSEAREGKVINKALAFLIGHVCPVPASFSEETLGFQVCPMLNASGRMRTAMSSFNFIDDEDDSRLQVRFDRLDSFNQLRKQLTRSLGGKLSGIYSGNALVGLMPGTEQVNEGIMGIIAGRLCEKYCRPSFVFTLMPDGTFKGSGRSTASYDLIHGAMRIFARHPEFGKAYGGHAGAMGISLPTAEDARKFGEELASDFEAMRTGPVVISYFDFSEIGETLEKTFAEEEEIGPFGESLSRPLIRAEGTVAAEDIRPLGQGTAFDMKCCGQTVRFNHFNEATHAGRQAVFFEATKDCLRNGSVYYKGNVVSMQDIA